MGEKDKQAGMFFDRNHLRYWFAIDIAIRYRYRSCPAFSIASSDIDSDPERTTTPVAARATSQENEKPICNLPFPK
ncbi:MAG: hypothetical protein BECKG1743D_GA0114223_101844 [Candidatus Kentron sp. G]|nr:MAG: hypothetical protein BECKG1743D_GA0114223_101844 [Candidatus Kentron sp. G]